jgi:hypothetical protein
MARLLKILIFSSERHGLDPKYLRPLAISAWAMERPKSAAALVTNRTDLSVVPSPTTAGSTRGRCYDHRFLRFSTIFGDKMAFFSKTNVMIKI